MPKSRMWALADSTSGPDRPKWVNSSSPCSWKTVFFLPFERGNRVFPASDKSIDIIDALFFELKRLNVTLTTWQRVSSVTLKDGAVSSVEIGTARDKWGWGEPCKAVVART